MSEKKQYWKGLEQLKNTPDFQKYSEKEFPEYLPIKEGEGDPSRRDFLKMMGFGVAAASLAACEAPVRYAIPYVNKPETVDPSIPNYYASTYVSGSDYCSVVVKTREGRPIKIEGNKLSSVTEGGTTAQAEASVLSLYDKERLQGPKIDGADADWSELDKQVMASLDKGDVTVVSNSLSSPSTLAVVQKLKDRYTNVKHVSYDAYSYHGTLDANAKSFGSRMMPSYDFSKAKTIVAFESDFLGVGPNKALNNKQFAASRKLGDNKKDMSRLYAIESNMSLTGANADYRIPIKPSQQGIFIASLYNKLAAHTGSSTVNVSGVNDEKLNKAVKELWENRGKSIVISGSNDPDIQILVNAINNILGNYGNTIFLNQPTLFKNGNDADFKSFVSDLKSGRIKNLIFYNCNPVYDHPLGADIEANISKASLTLSTSDRMDETTSLVKYIAPDHHFLESWNDFEPVKGKYSLSQPTISNLFDTRQAQDSFLKWTRDPSNYYDFLKSQWESNMFPLVDASQYYNFDAFWDKALHDGVFETEGGEEEAIAFDQAALSNVASGINGKYKKDNNNLELSLYVSGGVAEGMQANNPWLQEMPDPITKACWDNYVTASPQQVEEWGIEMGDMTTQKVNLTVDGKTVSLPVLPQPGQAYNTIGLALGYGRTKAGKVANGVGVNAYQFIDTKGSFSNYSITSGVSVEPTSESYKVAQTQTTQTYMGRETVIQESVLKEYQKDPQAGRHFPKIATSEGFKKPYAVSLWKGHKYANHHWGMAIDLNSCTGCGTCTIACQSENNIPVVGKEEVLNRREMHWIRIDRYYSHDPNDLTENQKNARGFTKPEFAAVENPEVVFQPMMCQQCNNAPCETVCPVAATTHSSEGLNQMTYNRCIGTRYCANNCPYKVRRFNWFKYHDNDQFGENLAMNNDLGKMVLNPDVTVRARGVMEKCTFCVQRIQAGKLQAKRELRRPEDGEVQTACVSSCPSDALVFGDMKDPGSKISQLLKIESQEKGVETKEPRAYHVLEELRVMPNVWYLTKIRNKDEVKKSHSGGHHGETHKEENAHA